MAIVCYSSSDAIKEIDSYLNNNCWHEVEICYDLFVDNKHRISKWKQK
jgi:hypothetical protein